MPELPEVETVVRELRPHLVGQRIVAVDVSRKRLRWPWRPQWGRCLTSRPIGELARRGKWIVAGLEGGQRLLIHLGMTGQLTVVPVGLQRAAHTHVVFTLEEGGKELRFRDVRRFGGVRLFTDQTELDQFFEHSELGPEPFGLGSRYWFERLSRTIRALKAVLLDQRVVAGVGNIYADEALFEARLHPARPGRTLSFAEAHRLSKAVVRVLQRAIQKRGASIRDYVGGLGRRGSYQEEFRVYGRTGQPCPRCRSRIECIRLAGRATHYCPQCQANGQG